MTRGELLNFLKRKACEFRVDSDHYQRNSHMHGITEAPPQEVIDAVLVGFINYVGISQGIDFGLYASDLAKPEK